MPFKLNWTPQYHIEKEYTLDIKDFLINIELCVKIVNPDWLANS